MNTRNNSTETRRRRAGLGVFALVSLVVLGIGLVMLGFNSLQTLLQPGGARVLPTPFSPQVQFFATQPSPEQANPPTVAPATDQPRNIANPTQPAAPTAALQRNAGAVAGLDNFYCPQDKDRNPNTKGVPMDRFGYGIKSNWGVGEFPKWNEVVSDKLKLTWIGVKINWYEFEPEKGKPDLNRWKTLDGFMADANWRRLRVAMTLTQPPKWSRSIKDAEGVRPSPPDDPNETVRFAGLLAQRYKGCVSAIEIFNEVNLDRDWKTPANTISAVDYIKHLQPAAAAIRAADPSILVVMAAPSPTGNDSPGQSQDDFRWLDAFIAAAGLQNVDCIGVHLNGFNFPPDKRFNEGYNDKTAKFRGPFDNPHHSWSFLSTIETYRQKTNKPLCVTEFGWPSMDGLEVNGAPPYFDFALDNTAQEQADWIAQSFKMLREMGYVRFAVVFNLDYIVKTSNTPDKDNALPYSLINKKGLPRPAFDAIERMPKS